MRIKLLEGEWNKDGEGRERKWNEGGKGKECWERASRLFL